MKTLEQYIKHYFDIVAPAELQQISSLFVPEQLSKGAYFVKTGQHCRKLSFIRSGILRMYAHTDEKEITQWIGTEGYFVTDLSSLLFGQQSRWTIQALSEVELFSISIEHYRKIGRLVRQWDELEKMFLAKCFTTMEHRIFDLLSLSAEERYKQFFAQQPELFNQVPLQYIASMLGMTPETFSSIRKKMLS